MSTDMADASGAYYASELLRLVRVIEDARYGMVAAYSLGVYEWLLSYVILYLLDFARI